MEVENHSLNNKDNIIQFYDDRYTKGYMDVWPLEKKKRVFEIIKSLNLPERGKALDFGCGNGVFTDILKQALPKWEICGTDLSSVAVENAKVRIPDCNFYLPTDEKLNKFDFLFSHHVLEHVYDIDKTWDEINYFLHDKACILHIFPCGNSGSFEHSICQLRKDGINKSMENRFFFEDEGHLRRLTTEQVCENAQKYGFKLSKEFYAYQHYGAIKWISENGPKFILMLTDCQNAIDKTSKRKLRMLRLKLLFFSFLNRPCFLFKHKLEKKQKSAKDYLMLIVVLPFLLGFPVYLWTKHKAEEEWEKRKTDQKGSEMYLFFKR